MQPRSSPRPAWLALACGFALLLSVSGVRAQQGAAPQSPGVQAAVGTAFTYQGRLTTGGSPANGAFDFEFRLFDALSGGVQSGGAVTQADVPVGDGLFATPLDFGAVFTGTALFLEIAVRPGAETGAFTTLAPRQPITPAPYALALPGLRTQNYNVIGGHLTNHVTNGSGGATIGGGGGIFPEDANIVTDHYGTIAGGRSNQAGDGGDALASYATVGGGLSNVAGGTYSVVGGGYSNTASGVYSIVDGGRDNLASGFQATVGGGFNNTAVLTATTISGGEANIAGSSWSTVGGGRDNTTLSPYATVPGGTDALASHYGEMAYAGGQFGAVGDAQTSVYVLRRTTTAFGVTELFLDGADDRLTIASGRTVVFDILIVGRSDAAASAGFHIRGVIENVNGTTAFVGSPENSLLGRDSAWEAYVAADDANNALSINVLGSPNTNIRWVATVRTVEVSW